MHVKTGVQSGSARKAPKDRAKIAESAIIVWKMRMPQSNEPTSGESDGIHPASFF